MLAPMNFEFADHMRYRPSGEPPALAVCAGDTASGKSGPAQNCHLGYLATAIPRLEPKVNRDHVKINWGFTRKRARAKFG
jgi:hypothetical protein